MFYDDPKKHGLKFNPLKALVAPRPIAWVSSRSVDGVPNLAPYSFFNAVSEFPPMIVFAPHGPRPSGAGAKDTLENTRSEERRGGKECGSTVQYRWSPCQ